MPHGALGATDHRPTFSGQRVGSLGCSDGFMMWECHPTKINQTLLGFWIRHWEGGAYSEIGWCKLEPASDHICTSPWVSHKTTWRKLICSRKELNISKLRNGHRETQNDMESLHPVMPEINSIPGAFISGVNKYSAELGLTSVFLVCNSKFWLRLASLPRGFLIQDLFFWLFSLWLSQMVISQECVWRSNYKETGCRIIYYGKNFGKNLDGPL